jgi:hypothetical protein
MSSRLRQQAATSTTSTKTGQITSSPLGDADPPQTLPVVLVPDLSDEGYATNGAKNQIREPNVTLGQRRFDVQEAKTMIRTNLHCPYYK